MITSFGWGGPRILLIDDNPGAIGAYSLRQLSGFYNGAAIRLRRDSDSAEADIGFTNSGDFDMVAFIAFQGMANCYVKTWYDQTGNGKDITQTTFSKQPKFDGTQLIFDAHTSGVTKMLVNSSWTNQFSYIGGGSIYFVISSADSNASAGNAMDTILSQDDLTNYDMNFATAITSNAGVVGGMFGRNSGWLYGNNNKTLNTYYLLNFEWQNWSSFLTDGHSKIRWTDTENSPYHSTSLVNPTTISSGTLRLGASNATNFAPYSFEGKIKEVIIYPLNNNNALSLNIRSYYGL